MPRVHPTALVDPAACLADDVQIGPFCVVGAGARLEAGVELMSHVVIRGRASVGEGTRVWPFAVLGAEPQDVKHDGSATSLEVGTGCQIREHVTLHRGTSGGGRITRIGDDCLLMVGCHVGHDGRVGDGCIFANQVHLGGHCRVGDRVNIGACTGVHQYVRIGDGAFVGGGSIVVRDVVPYGLASGNRAVLQGVNLRGLRRLGLDRGEVREIRRLVHDLFGPGEATLSERLQDVGAGHPLARRIVEFVRADSTRRYLPAELS